MDEAKPRAPLTPNRPRRGWIVLVCLFAVCTPGSSVFARQAEPTRSARRGPVLVLSATQRITSAMDASRARHIPPRYGQWDVQVDSAVGGVLFARLTTEPRIRYRVDGVLRLPVRGERLATPGATSMPSRLRGTSFGDPTSMLSLADAERAANQDDVLTATTFAAAFDGLPNGPGEIHIADSASQFALRVDAVRRYRVLGDSVVNGRAVRVVRDSTSISYTRRTRIPSRFTAVQATSTEAMQGAIVGTRVVDLGTRRTVAMSDTVRLRGRHVVDDGYGGVADLPWYELHTSRVTVRDSLSPPQAQAPFDVVQMEGRRAPRGVVSVDSTMALLRRTRSVEGRDSIRRQFRFSEDTVLSRGIIASALAIGDTAAAVRFISEPPYGSPRAPVTEAIYRLLRTQLQDPAAALRVGVDRELLAINLIDGLLRAPPVLSPPGQDSALCTPAACRAMARDANAPGASAALRAVALVAAMVTTPRGWTDSVTSNARTNPLLAGRAEWFARGASSTATASAKAPIPDADASPETWRFWLRGEDSNYVVWRARVQSNLGVRAVPSSGARMTLVSDQAATAIRFAERRRGPSFVGSYARAFRAQREASADDATRALFAALLMATGDSVFTTPELRALVLGPPSQERDVALRTITTMRRGSIALAPDSIATAIGLRVVESLYAGRPLSFVADARTNGPFFAAPPDVDSLPRYVSMDSLPPVVRARAAALGRAPMPMGWSFVPGTSGITTHFSAVRTMGQFASINVSFTTLHARDAGRSGGYANGYTLWFVDGPAGWVVFSTSSWVT